MSQKPRSSPLGRRSRSADRHSKDSRKSIAIPKELHQLLAELAQRNRRPKCWELRVALEKHLQAAGLDIPTDPPVDS